ncbi:hypothetical protein HK101_007698 [Irineochytrium annulatum]|nr:hypothetical protein HK101_007698 [Irineochytrium annulatum]
MHALPTIVLFLSAAVSAVIASPPAAHARLRSAAPAPSPPPKSPSNDAEFFPQGGVSEVKKLNAFANEDFKIDLNNNPLQTTTDGGSVSRMDINSMAALQGQGVSLVFTTLKPCAAADPNVHARASEAIFFFSGSSIRVGFISENTGNLVMNDLAPGESTFIPQGALHFVINDSCEDAVFTGSFNNEDPGQLALPAGIYMLPDDIIESAFGIEEQDLTTLRKKNPANPSPGTETCLQRCFGSDKYAAYGSPGGKIAKNRRAAH